MPIQTSRHERYCLTILKTLYMNPTQSHLTKTFGIDEDYFSVERFGLSSGIPQLSECKVIKLSIIRLKKHSLTPSTNKKHQIKKISK